MAGFTIRGEVEGLAEIIATLNGLPDKLQRKIVRRALSKATKPVVAAARKLVPVDSGRLKKSIGRKVVTFKESGTLVVIIGPRKGYGAQVQRNGRTEWEDPVKIAHLVEFGTKAHGVGRKSASYRPSGKQHPGARQKPFLRPAFEETKARVQEIFAQEVAAGLEREMAKS